MNWYEDRRQGGFMGGGVAQKRDPLGPGEVAGSKKAVR